MVQCGILLERYGAVVTISLQRNLGNQDLFRRHIAMTISVLLSRSEVPFCCGVYNAVNSWSIPGSL